jgi:protein-tyrosine phosphatase
MNNAGKVFNRVTPKENLAPAERNLYNDPPTMSGQEHNPSKKRHGSLHFLFVCYANICRSPMAEGIARTFHNDSRIYAESAGIAAMDNGAAPQAVEVMRSLYDVDISGHRSRNVSQVKMEDFDFIVAMDAMVYQYLKALKKIPSDKLFEWDIHDPVGQPVFVFRKVAEKIRKRIEQFLINREIH